MFVEESESKEAASRGCLHIARWSNFYSYFATSKDVADSKLYRIRMLQNSSAEVSRTVNKLWWIVILGEFNINMVTCVFYQLKHLMDVYGAIIMAF